MNESIKLVCFDVDDTLIEQNSWERLNAALGITPEEDTAMYHQYKNGEITYAQWQEKLETLYAERGLVSKETVNEVLTKFVLKPGAKELVTYLQSQGYEIALISGSFVTLVEAIANELGIKHSFGANKLELTGNVSRPIALQSRQNSSKAKLAYLEALCEQLAITVEQCVCIADGANDRLMFEATGRGITFAGSQVSDVAWKTVTNLSEVKEIL